MNPCVFRVPSVMTGVVEPVKEGDAVSLYVLDVVRTPVSGPNGAVRPNVPESDIDPVIDERSLKLRGARSRARNILASKA